MTIPLTGVKGLLNRINMFASIQQHNVYEVTAYIEQFPEEGWKQVVSKTKLLTASEKIINTGQNQTTSDFLWVLMDDYFRMSSKEDLQKIQSMTFHPEFNVGTSKIGEGYKKIGNIVMLMARAECHTQTGHDLMPYEYMQTLMNNGSMLIDLSKNNIKKEKPNETEI